MAEQILGRLDLAQAPFDKSLSKRLIDVALSNSSISPLVSLAVISVKSGSPSPPSATATWWAMRCDGEVGGDERHWKEIPLGMPLSLHESAAVRQHTRSDNAPNRLVQLPVHYLAPLMHGDDKRGLAPKPALNVLMSVSPDM